MKAPSERPAYLLKPELLPVRLFGQMAFVDQIQRQFYRQDMSVIGKLFSVDRLSLKHDLPSRVAKPALLAFLSSGLFAASGLIMAQTLDGPLLYQLNADSSCVQGCFPPCLCPIMAGVPVKGTFLLTPSGSDGFFNTYTVSDVNWLVSINGTATVVNGSGTFKLGGETAFQQELSLDLQIGGGKVEHFDSGLVADSTPLPDMKVTVSLHGQVCFDTVFDVSASPSPMPQLHVALASTRMLALSWPVFPVPFVLQENSGLTSTNWTIVTNTPTVEGQENQVVVGRSSSSKFYRLVPVQN